MLDRFIRAFLVIGGVSAVCAWTWPGAFPEGDPVAVLVRYHTPNYYAAVVVWYYLAPGVAVFLIGQFLISTSRIWFARMGVSLGLRSRLPAWPLSPTADGPAIVVGEVHNPVRAIEIPTPEWLMIPERGLSTGVAILGAVSSGKTSACMHPVARQLLGWQADNSARRPAALVLEVKGDFCHDIRRMWITIDAAEMRGDEAQFHALSALGFLPHPGRRGRFQAHADASVLKHVKAHKITHDRERFESASAMETRLRVEAVNHWYVHDWNTLDNLSRRRARRRSCGRRRALDLRPAPVPVNAFPGWAQRPHGPHPGRPHLLSTTAAESRQNQRESRFWRPARRPLPPAVRGARGTATMTDREVRNLGARLDANGAIAALVDSLTRPDRDRRRRSGDAPPRAARAAPWSSRPEVHGRTQGAEPMKLTRAQAHRLIELYGYTGPREPAVERLTTAELFVFDAPRRDRLELDTDLSGEPVSWVAQDEIDRIIYD